MAYHIDGITRWDPEQLKGDAKTGRALFRERRLAESREELDEVRSEIERACKMVVPQLHRVLGPVPDQALLAQFVRSKRGRLALRCVGTPPISDADLDTLVEGSVTTTAIRNDEKFARLVASVLVGIMDHHRFPWIMAGRDPTEIEVEGAIMATTTLAAAGAILAQRRGDERDQLEAEVHDLLDAILKKIPSKHIIMPSRDGPKPGQYMKNAMLGEHGADAIVGLYDHRLLAFECKASNSEINSRKRLNKEVVADAKDWLDKFGVTQVIPAAAIRGVFKVDYLVEAQNVPIALFWSHRLSDIEDFIESTRPESGPYSAAEAAAEAKAKAEAKAQDQGDK